MLGWCHPFFQALQVGKQLKWTEEYDKALTDLKEYLANPPDFYTKTA